MIKVKKVQNLRWDDPGKFHNTASCVFCSKGIVEYTFFWNHKRHLCVSFKLFIFPKFMDCLKLRELMKVYESLKLFLAKKLYHFFKSFTLHAKNVRHQHVSITFSCSRLVGVVHHSGSQSAHHLSSPRIRRWHDSEVPTADVSTSHRPNLPLFLCEKGEVDLDSRTEPNEPTSLYVHEI